MKQACSILLVEDDPTSRTVLAAALAALPAHVDAVADIRAAAAHATARRYGLWLIDAHLPDGTGAELLARLRRLDGDAIAVAHTASCDAVSAANLRAAGFADVVIKPLPAEGLRDRVRTVLAGAAVPSPTPAADADAEAPACREIGAAPLLDDAAAAAALGDAAHVVALRRLFAAELAVLHVQTGATTMQADLHRLQASCGFVGATRLGVAAVQLQQRDDATTREAFAHALEQTRAALDEDVAYGAA